MQKQLFLIFVVDDDPFYNHILSKHLLNLRQIPGFSDYDIFVQSYYSAKECLDNIHQEPDVVLLDYFLDESGHPLKGLYLLNNIKEICKKCKVILISQQQAMLASVEFLQQGGAYDYVVKDTSSLMKISNIIEDILHREHQH
jgi:two-component system, NtrC family, response regulator AtoC